MGKKHTCVPCASEAQYRDSVDHPTQYRQYLRAMLGQHPALFPKDMDQGFPLHDAYASLKQDLTAQVRSNGYPSVTGLGRRTHSA